LVSVKDIRAGTASDADKSKAIQDRRKGVSRLNKGGPEGSLRDIAAKIFNGEEYSDGDGTKRRFHLPWNGVLMSLKVFQMCMMC
jgi:hypothetical protein